MDRKTRLQDIAGRLGISVSTVHRAMAKPEMVSDSLREKIREVAEELGYEVNLVASSLSSKKTFRFVVLCADNIFYKQAVAGARAAEKELQVYGVTVDFLYCRGSVYADQIAQLENICSEMTYEGVVLAPVHLQLVNPAVNRLVEKGLPVVTIINDIPDSARSFYVGQNPKAAGETAAYLYDAALPGGSTVAVMGSYIDHGLGERVESFKKYLAGTDKRVVNDIFHYHETVESAYEMCSQILTIIDPAAIFCHSMYGTIGCARAIKDLNKRGKTFMIGFDLNEEIKSFLDDGTLFATLYHAPFLQAGMAVKKLFSLVKGSLNGNVDCHYVETNVVFKTNAASFMLAEY